MKTLNQNLNHLQKNNNTIIINSKGNQITRRITLSLLLLIMITTKRKRRAQGIFTTIIIITRRMRNQSHHLINIGSYRHRIVMTSIRNQLLGTTQETMTIAINQEIAEVMTIIIRRIKRMRNQSHHLINIGSHQNHQPIIIIITIIRNQAIMAMITTRITIIIIERINQNHLIPTKQTRRKTKCDND